VTDNSVPLIGGPEPSSSLLVRVKAREEAAWDRLVRLCTPLVLAWCHKGGLQAADAQDVGQEVFRAVFDHIAAFRRDRPGDSFRAWLRSITRSKIADHFRRRQDQPAGIGGSEALTRTQQVQTHGWDDLESEEDDAGLLYERALRLIQAEFEEDTWRAFLAVVRDGRPAREVAAELGKAPNAVYLATSRVRKRLREEFAGILDVE
jgi:RNA polymerase sigma-70 factor (ECF subfamily)